jgi:pimeloyl-ACP methyl ester carboxylesterase
MNCPATQCVDARYAVHPGAAGDGETVLLLHGSAGSGALWRETARLLRPLYRVIAPDLIGYGRSPSWPKGLSFAVDAEREVLEHLLPCCAEKYHLVGYSYGGVVALALALASPTRVRTLTLIEPVFFAALRYVGDREAYDRLGRVRDDFVAGLARGERETAMRRFIDFWSGDGAWEKLSSPIRADMLAMTDKIVLDWEAAFALDPGRAAIAALGPRTALLRGDQSPEPMRRLVDALHRLMPGSSHAIIAPANHLLPLTHASAVANAILAHYHAEAERRLC